MADMMRRVQRDVPLSGMRKARSKQRRGECGAGRSGAKRQAEGKAKFEMISETPKSSK